MKKRILSIVLTMCLVLTLVPTMVFADTPISDFTYGVSTDGQVTILKYTGKATDVTIPDEIDGKTVTSIGAYVFHNCQSLASVTIPSSVQTIGSNAFENCTSLASVTIPDSVTSIEQEAFRYCTSLTSITIPGSVISIGQGAFNGCTSLASITILSGVQTIGQHAFQNCTSLASVTIPGSVTSIADYVFWGCTSLASITIPDSVTSIGQSAFRECTSLASITIPDSVTSIGQFAFWGCTSLASIAVDEDNNDYLSVGGVLFSKNNVLIQYPMGNTATSYSIPDGVTSIGIWAFQNCTSLASITIPSGVQTIEMCAFLGCTNLTSVAIPGSVVSIADSAFENCTSLESIFLPDNDSLSIDDYAIPSTVTQVKYSLDETAGEVTITGIALGTDKTGVAIPATICGYDVVAVATSEQSKIGAHTCKGGTATCTAKASCSLCGKEYGEVDSSNHNLEKISAKDATVTETGNKEYWHCKDCNKYYADENGTKEMKLDDTVTQKLPPEMIEGKGQSITAGEKKALTFRSNAAFGDFIRVELDGKTLDEKNYTVKEGSTMITLKADYVATLSAGEHTIGIVSASGTAAAAFTVQAKTAVPPTGDNSHMALWMALLFVSGGLLTITGVYSKKKKHSESINQ